MLEIKRMEAVLLRRPSFVQRIFTEEERRYCEGSPWPAQHYAARFAAREAVLKALGTGFGCGIGFADVSVTLDERGAPQVRLSGRAAEFSRELGIAEIAVSLSHTRDFAVANAVAVHLRDKPEKKSVSSGEERARKAYREAREILRDLDGAFMSPEAADIKGDTVVDTEAGTEAL